MKMGAEAKYIHYQQQPSPNPSSDTFHSTSPQASYTQVGKVVEVSEDLVLLQVLRLWFDL